MKGKKNRGTETDKNYNAKLNGKEKKTDIEEERNRRWIRKRRRGTREEGEKYTNT